MGLLIDLDTHSLLEGEDKKSRFKEESISVDAKPTLRQGFAVLIRKRLSLLWKRSQFWNAPIRTQSSVTTLMSLNSNLHKKKSVRRTLRSSAQSHSSSKHLTRQ